MQIGAADIEITLAPAHEQPGREAVDKNADPGHDHDSHACNRLRIW
jgi:hypothetical protein